MYVSLDHNEILFLEEFSNSRTDFLPFSQFPYLDSDAAEGGDGLDSQVPQCETGCAASLLGLESVTQIQLLNHLKASILIL